MCDKEYIEIFDRIWHADIINMKEPLYSIATSVAEYWSPYPEEGVCSRPQFKQILLEKLELKWKNELIKEMRRKNSTNLGFNDVQDIIGVFRIRYKNDPAILKVLDRISAIDTHEF